MRPGARWMNANDVRRGRGAAWFAAALLIVTAIAAAARLYHLDRPSFWGDELRSVGAAGMSLEQLRASPRAFGQLPTMIGLKASGVDLSRIDPDRPDMWRAIGVTEWNARIGACVVGILTIPILVLAGRRMLGPNASLFAGLLLALAPWHIVWSQAARFYSLQFLFYTLCLILYFQWRSERSSRMLVAAVAALVLALLSQPTALLAVAVIGADLVIGLWRREISFTLFETALICGGGVVCAGFLGYYIAISPDTWLKFLAFTGKGHHYPTTLMAGTLYMVQLPIVAVAALSAIWLMKHDRRLGTFLLLAAFVPLLVLSVWSMRNFVGLRYVLITLWWWLALAAVGLSALYQAILAHCSAIASRREAGASSSVLPLHSRALAIAPAALAVAALLVPLYAYYEDGYGYRGRWREAFEYAMAHRLPGEKIATTRNQVHVAQYYSGERDVREMRWTLDEMTKEFHSPTWIVFHAETSVRGTEQEWAREGAEMRAVFDLRVPQPIEKVSVYRFIPGLAEARTQGLSGAEISQKTQ